MLIITTLLVIVIGGCTSAHHGTFVTSTYTDSGKTTSTEYLGEVTGESIQTMLFYVIPIGEPASTNEAIINARSKYKDTKLLVDVSIDDRIYWGFGYARQIIQVRAKAHK